MGEADERAGSLSTELENLGTRLLKAQSHPLRAEILARLEDGECSPRELSDELGAPLGVIAYHFRRLLDLELIELTRQTKRRGSIEHHYVAVTRR